MKAQIVFDLKDEEDKIEFEEFSSENGKKLKSAMWNFAHQVLRQYRKYGGLHTAAGILDTDSAETAGEKAAQHIEDLFYQHLEDSEAKIED